MQKTAYEMRISDWSSDVCSSDLLPARLGIPQRHRAAPAFGAAVDTAERVDHPAVLLNRAVDVRELGHAGQADGPEPGAGRDLVAGAHRDAAALHVAVLPDPAARLLDHSALPPFLPPHRPPDSSSGHDAAPA